MNSQELKRLLAAQGCSFETHKGGSGHVTVRRGDRNSAAASLALRAAGVALPPPPPLQAPQG
jgi:hypothetical protein